MIDKMFGFELKQEPFDWIYRRPSPPNEYIEFNHNKGLCPNCGTERPGTVSGKNADGFQDRRIQNLWRAFKRVNDLECDYLERKSLYDLFNSDIIPEKGPLNCHPSRFGIGKFACCGAQIWHDFYTDPGKKPSIGEWKHYYHPTPKNKTTLQQWL